MVKLPILDFENLIVKDTGDQLRDALKYYHSLDKRQDSNQLRK